MMEMKKKWEAGKLAPPKFQERNGILFHKGKVVVSSQHDFRTKVLQELYDSPLGGHLGYEKALNKVRAVFWWKKMRGDIKEYIRAFHVCQMNKYENCPPTGLLQPLPIPSKVWANLATDFIDSSLLATPQRSAPVPRRHSGLRST